MSSESMSGNGVAEQGPLGSTSVITGISSVSEVIDFLRLSFQTKDFSLGEKILTDRENALKAEIENLRVIANESTRKEREFEKWKMMGELKKLKSENEDLGRNNDGLKREIEELKAEKREVEEKLEATEKRYAELDGRLSRLEEHLADVAARTGLNSNSIADNLDEVLAAEYDGLTVGTQNHLQGPTVTTLGGSTSKKEVPFVDLSDDEDEVTVGSVEFLGKNEMTLTPQIMTEVRGESLKRKRSIGNDDGDSSSFSIQKQKYTQELMHETEVTPVFECPKNRGDVGMSTYEFIAGVKCEAMAGKCIGSHTNLKPQKVGRRQWLDQNEMCLALADDLELCISAICALYRKLISAPVSLKPVDRGFEPNDQLGVELAKYLIDGHPENKLNRSMSEVSKVAAEQSKRLALKYSGQLFRIYSSGEDPLFCPNTRSSKH